jgi:hypothetical protein
MRSSREDGQHVLNLPRHEKADQWDTFWNCYFRARGKSTA